VCGDAHALWQGDAEAIEQRGLGDIGLRDAAQPDLTERGGRQHDVVGLDTFELFNNGARGVRGARARRDRILLEVLYAGGLRVSELVALTWSDVLPREGGQVQLSVVGKGGVVRQVLLPAAVSRSLLSVRGDAGADAPVFASRKGGGPLLARAVRGTVSRAAAKAGLEAPISPHWLRHAHASHAIDRGATLPEVQSTLGHSNVATTSGYLHARPESSSGLRLDPGVWLR
jgi:site-specific recombinase XerD